MALVPSKSVPLLLDIILTVSTSRYFWHTRIPLIFHHFMKLRHKCQQNRYLAPEISLVLLFPAKIILCSRKPANPISKAATKKCTWKSKTGIFNPFLSSRRSFSYKTQSANYILIANTCIQMLFNSILNLSHYVCYVWRHEVTTWLTINFNFFFTRFFKAPLTFFSY